MPASPASPRGTPPRAASKRASARTASELVASAGVSRRHVYAATLVLARLNDRGVGFSLTLEDMCEVLGYLGGSRRPAHVEPRPMRRARVA